MEGLVAPNTGRTSVAARDAVALVRPPVHQHPLHLLEARFTRPPGPRRGLLTPRSARRVVRALLFAQKLEKRYPEFTAEVDDLESRAADWDQSTVDPNPSVGAREKIPNNRR